MVNKLFHCWVVLLAVALVWGDGAAIWAAPVAQDDGDMLDFEKPDWGVTMQYPAGWTAEDLGDVVKFTADDYATFAVMQDDAFRDMKRSLNGVIQTALNKMGSKVMGLRVKPQQGAAGRREAVISATDPTYLTSWLGYVVQFVAGDAGYVLLCAAPGDSFQDRQTVFSAMGESIKFAGLETPTPTPKPASTRTPRKKTPTPARRAETSTPAATSTQPASPTETPTSPLVAETATPAITPTVTAGPTATPTLPPIVETTTPALTSTVTAGLTATPDASATTVAAGAPVFTFFFADWCGPCKQMRPAIDELKTRYSDRIQFAYVNVDDPGGMEAAHKYSVKSLPHFVLVKPSGEIVGQWEGRQDPAVFPKALDALLAGAVN